MDSVDAKPVTVEQPIEYQGITIWLGDGAPCSVDDASRPQDIADWIDSPIQRAVAIARLRAVADMLESADPKPGKAGRGETIWLAPSHSTAEVGLA